MSILRVQGQDSSKEGDSCDICELEEPELILDRALFLLKCSSVRNVGRFRRELVDHLDIEYDHERVH